MNDQRPDGAQFIRLIDEEEWFYLNGLRAAVGNNEEHRDQRKKQHKINQEKVY